MKKQTAGRDKLGKLAPQFAHLNDDVLFGEVWSREEQLSARDRSMITIAALFSAGQYPQLKSHLQMGKEHGVTKREAVELVTHLAFYCGWPKAWSTFPLIEEVYADEDVQRPLFGLGEPNTAFGKYFTGQSYLKPLNAAGVGVFNVSFEPRCRNNWHIHHGGGQILLCTDGNGWYQQWGEEARALRPGDVVYIAPEIKHWHGAAKDGWFTHIAIEIPSEHGGNEWCEPVDDEHYDKLG